MFALTTAKNPVVIKLPKLGVVGNGMPVVKVQYQMQGEIYVNNGMYSRPYNASLCQKNSNKYKPPLNSLIEPGQMDEANMMSDSDM